MGHPNQLIVKKRYGIYSLHKIDSTKSNITEVIGVQELSINYDFKRYHGEQGLHCFDDLVAYVMVEIGEFTDLSSAHIQ